MDRRARLSEALFGLGLDVRHRAARLAAILYTLGAVTLLVSARFLSHVDQRALVLVAVLALASTSVVLLPWRRFPLWTTALPLVWGVSMICLTGAWAGGLSHFVLFYGLASLYVGLVERPGSWVWVTPLYLASVSLALLGNEPADSSVDLIGSAGLAVVIGEVLAGAVARSRKASQGTETLLEAVTSLQRATTEDEAADQVAALAHSLLAPAGVLVMVATGQGSPLFVNRGQRGSDRPLGSIVIDSAARNGIAQALSEQRPVFIADPARSPLPALHLIAKLGFASVLFIPVPGEGGYLGCVVVGWKQRRPGLDRFEEQVVAMLSEQAGSLLERLRSVGVLRHQVHTDPLTGLSNRRVFLDALGQLRPGGAVVFLDLDHFKALNDTQGHLAGDAVLQQFAVALQASVRDGDCAARYGGEEFALVLPCTEGLDMGASAQLVVERLWQAWQGPVTFSAGIAVHRAGDAPSTTLARADAAVYEAKAAGRNTLVVA